MFRGQTSMFRGHPQELPLPDKENGGAHVGGRPAQSNTSFLANGGCHNVSSSAFSDYTITTGRPEPEPQTFSRPAHSAPRRHPRGGRSPYRMSPYSRCRSSSPNSKSPSSFDHRNRPLRMRYDASHRLPGSPSWDYEHARRSGGDCSGHYSQDSRGILPSAPSSGFGAIGRPSSQGTFRHCPPSVESIPVRSIPELRCPPSSTLPSRPSLSDEQKSQPKHSTTSSRFHPYPTPVPLQPAFDPTPRSIIPLPDFHRCFTVQQLCGTEDTEPNWASEIAIIQGAPIRAVQPLAPTLEAEVLVNRWRNEVST
ncbi:uncharacterized protein EI90DRAFT_3052771 [Cantharellus anzutake]|uniref:uncharacterized protein n=1 Tax=Cantharellus anzutake TaxID=1750568 RepID=UPI00190892EE|nr:uncharacterized protein EI90DRAFT_3052771 [Cantharellus anzutake]KAF8333041.1 hypothetical protein EI90DRAFT_3052771 [Cantharellus anzutake]